MKHARSMFVIPLLLGACGGHEAEDLSTIPIAPIAGDALFVVNGSDSSISVVDAASEQVTGTIELVGAEYPHHIYLSPDRATLFVAIPGSDLSGGHGGGGGHGGPSGGVLALDATTGETRVARRLDAPNHNAVFAAGAVWTSQIASPGELLLLDPTTLATRSTITVGEMPAEVTFASSGSVGFVANTGADSVSIIDPTTGAVLDTVAVGDGPVGAWPGSDGRMYVDNETGKSISVIDPDTRTVVATFDLGFTPALAAISPDGDLWVTDTENGKLVFFDAGTGARLGELATGAGAHALAFSPDGAKAYVTNQEAGTLSVINVAARTLAKTIPVGAKPNGLAYRTF